MLTALTQSILSTFYYYQALYEYIYLHTQYTQLSILHHDKWAKVHLYSLSLIFLLWSQSHYRSKSFQIDMINNLNNVAIPGTGIPLSYFALNWYIALFFILFINPFICLCGAINKTRNLNINLISKIEKTLQLYIDHLLHPDDWFSFWRLNCRLASYHSLLTNAPGYAMEDKWTFLQEGHKRNVPVSPFITDMEVLVCKNKNVEGGMGIHFYTNAACGGDWILQEKLSNADWMREILPPNAPLSTMRVITCSTWYIHNDEVGGDENSDDVVQKYITPLSSVLRLGRQNAATDHSSVLFDVDTSSGTIRRGVTNAQWYRLGLSEVVSCPWLPPDVRASCDACDSMRNDQHQDDSRHPDVPNTTITGRIIPNMQQALDICSRAHYDMMKDVPMVGWDVTFTPKGVFLLEVNLSCNFFRGSFDIPKYIDIVDQYWAKLEKVKQD